MGSQYQGKHSSLIPPMTIGGVTYSFAVVVNAEPTNQPAGGVLIVTGTIYKIENLGGNYRRIVFTRGVYWSHATLNPDSIPGHSFEYEWPWGGGGNIVFTSEEQRGIAYNNTSFIGGGDSALSLIPGDFLAGTNGRRFLVTDCAALNYPPDHGVDWDPGESLPTNQKRVNNCNSIQPDVKGMLEIYFDPTNTGVWGGTSIAYTGGVPGSPDRKVFTNPSSGLPDPQWYPPDASFDEVVPEYWADPDELQFKLSTSHIVVGATSHTLNVWLRSSRPGEPLPDIADGKQIALQTDVAGTGYGTTSDQLLLTGYVLKGNFDHAFTIHSLASTSGTLEWRRSAADDSAMVQIPFSFEGSTVSLGTVTWRDVGGGTRANLVTVYDIYDVPFQVRLTRSDNTIKVFHRQNDAAAWTEAASAYFIGMPDNCDGMLSLGVASGGLRAEPHQGPFTFTLQEMHAYGEHGYLDEQVFPTAFFLQVQRGSANAITEVRNMTTNSAMSVVTSSHTRNVYDLSGDYFYFYSESALDEIRISYAAAAPGPGTGRPPRVFNQTNGATLVGDGSTSTTNVNENRLNWHDTADFYDPHDEFDLAVGDEVPAYRFGIFDPRNPTTLSTDSKNADTDWTEVAGGNVLRRDAEGIRLFKREYLDAIVESGRLNLCTRDEGVRFRTGAGFDERIFNELRGVFAGLNNLAVEVTLSGSFADQVTGSTSQMAVGPTGFTCYNDGSGTSRWVPTGHDWGTSYLFFSTDPVGGRPYWTEDFGSGLIFQVDSNSHTVAPTAATVECNNGDPGQPVPQRAFRSNLDVTIAGEFGFNVSPFGDVGGALVQPHWSRENYRYEGGVVVSDAGLDPSLCQFFGGTSGDIFEPAIIQSQFRFLGIPISPAGILARMPEGSTIEQAFLECTFGGYRSVAWSGTRNHYPNGDYSWSYSEGGHLIASRSNIGGVDTGDVINPILPTPPSAGSVGFRVVGRRKNTGSIELYNGMVVPADASTLTSLGNIVTASAIQEGLAGQVEITGAIQSLLDHLDSNLGDFYLWPTTASNDADDGPGALGSYLRSLMPGHSASHQVGSPGYLTGFTSSCAGAFHWFTTLVIGKCIVRFKLADGTLSDWMVVPIVAPKLMPTP